MIKLLGHVWVTLLESDTTTVAAAAGQPGSTSLGGGGGAAAAAARGDAAVPAAALPGMLAYLSGSLSSLNPAVKLEAVRVILRVSKLGRRGSAAAAAAVGGGGGGIGGGSSIQPTGRLRLVGEVPPSTAAAAIEVGEG